MEALTDVHCYLWHGVRGNDKLYWNSITSLLHYLMRWQLLLTTVILK